jgi:transglutaminase-like putative cysteine protease
VLVGCCLLALVLAGGLVPSLTGGLADSPAQSLVPGNALSIGSGSSGPGSGDLGSVSGSGSGFGALSPGRSTDVGGNTGVDGNAFRSQDNTVHFRVTSPQPAYWRTGAYDRYTGTGWEQTGETTPFSGSIGGEGIQGPRVEYEVRLNRTARALPTVWRPNTIIGRPDVGVTEQRAIRAGTALGRGESYVGVSHRPPQDPAVLRAAGDDYPDAVADRYATLPADVPGRVELFTDDLTSQATTPYEKAVAIEEWLETTKTYSLNASRTSEHMADTFMFEMERGYCEYFATSMVVMLRSQDIPARYVVGYSTGERSGNTYTVRAMNAHAWVEVYFEDVGWVKFDPTPGSARLEQEQRSIRRENPGADYSPVEEGSPGETFTPEGEGTSATATPTPTPDEANGTDGTNATDDTTGGQTDTGYAISLNRTAVPGATVEVSVTRGGDPAAGVTVLFNGDPVGETDSEGTVVATVPYTDELRVAVDDGSVDSLAPPGAIPAADGRFHSVPPPSAGHPEVTIPVETNATVSVSGDPVPGGSVTVTATVSGVPVTDAPVTVDGSQVATTDANGRAIVSLPDRSGNVTIAVERDPVAGTTTVTLPNLSVSVTPSAPLALPLTGATVSVTADGDPVSSAAVSVDGRRVATTDLDGTATVQLPLAASATVSVRSFGLTRTATVSGLFVNLALTLVGLGLVLAAPLVVAARRGYSPRDVARILRRLPARLVRGAQWLLVTLATRGDDLLGRLLTRVRITVGHLVALVRGRVTPAALWAALLAWLAARREEFGADDGSDQHDDGATEATPSEARRTIRAAWARFLDRVSVRRHRTKTPGEIARHAVSRDGLPAEPVRVLRDAFREVEYGSRSATDRLDRVERALTAIERTSDEAETDGGTAEERAERDGGTE